MVGSFRIACLTSALILVVIGAQGSARAQGVSVGYGSPQGHALATNNLKSAVVADFDLDGDLDIAVCASGYYGPLGPTAGDVFLLSNTGGTLALQPVVHISVAPDELEVGDIDRDGRPDLLTSMKAGGSEALFVLRSLGNGQFANLQVLWFNSSFQDPQVADFNADGWLDVAVVENSSGLNVCFGSPGGLAAPVTVGSAAAYAGLLSGDVDGDGDVDLVVATDAAVHINDGTGHFAPASSLPGTTAAALGDWSGDGRPDLLTDVAPGLGTPGTALWLNNGSGVFTYHATLLPSGPSNGGELRSIADLDHDGRNDILLTQRNEVSVFLGRGGLAFTPVQLLTFGTTTQWALSPLTADFNGDLLPDLAVPVFAPNTSQSVEIAMQIAPPARVYCSAKVNSLGCLPSMGSTGVPSMTSPAPFTIQTSNVLNNKPGLFIHARAQAATPFQGGTLCLGQPIKREPAQSSGGTPPPLNCSGTYATNFNAYAQSGADPLIQAGEWVYVQTWMRDPQAAFGSGLSDALAFWMRP